MANEAEVESGQTTSHDTAPSAEAVDVAVDSNSDLAASEADIQTPQFADLPVSKSDTGTSMEHLYDVSVEVSAEIGRVAMTLGELLRIGEGSVIKLDRQVSAPVELIAQGVRVAMADVVVVDDHFAVRIRSIERSR